MLLLYEEAVKEKIIVEDELGSVQSKPVEVSCHESVDVMDDPPSVARLSQRIAKARDAGGRRLRLRRGITMDSGASANVMPRRMVRKPSQIGPSPGSRAGVRYVAAKDGIIKNEDNILFEFITSEGNSEMVTMHIAQVNKALGSVAYFVDRGYQVIFDKTGEDVSRMVHKASGRISKFRRERNIWILDAFATGEPVFSRPER